jgi:ABC-2 type transport system ATP-binding protein
MMHHDPSTAIHDSLGPQPGDIVVRKTRIGAMSTTDLDRQLRDRGIDTLVLAGISTSGVVLSTLIEAADRDYRLYVLSDGTEDPDEQARDVLLGRIFPRRRRSSTPPRCAGCCRRRLASVSTVPQVPAVEIGRLVKRYGHTTAVDGLTLSAAPGAVTGILGPNGAGKTTTIEICEGYRKPDQGTVRVLGLNPARDAKALRPRVGVMLQSGGIPPSVPAADYLNLLSRFHAHPLAVPALLDLVGLTAVARTPYKRLSGGQQQRLSLAAAVIGRPELVFLDEPTAGMDPQARHATWELIGQLRSAGVSIILTTHFMEEAERLCDYVAIIDHGQLVAAGTPGQLTGTVGQLRFRAEPGLDIDSLLAALPPASLAKESPAGHYVIEVHGAVDPLLLAAVTAWCAERGVLANSLRIESRTLEDVFLELTGKELRA